MHGHDWLTLNWLRLDSLTLVSALCQPFMICISRYVFIYDIEGSTLFFYDLFFRRLNCGLLDTY